jgi:hypothetical protein
VFGATVSLANWSPAFHGPRPFEALDSTVEDFRHWLIAPLLVGIKDGASCVCFRRASDCWKLAYDPGGLWYDMVHFPPSVPVGLAFRQLACAGLAPCRLRHRSARIAAYLLSLGRKDCPVILLAHGASAQIGIPWPTAIGGNLVNGQVNVRLQFGKAARIAIADFLYRTFPER